METKKEQSGRQEENLENVVPWKPCEEGVQGGENDQLHQKLLIYQVYPNEKMAHEFNTWKSLLTLKKAVYRENGRWVIKCNGQGFPGGAVVENLPANAEDTGSSPGLGRSPMPWNN